MSSLLQVGDRAPEFTLAAANRFENNRPQEFSLGRLLTKGPVILEFLRGTW